ncbi:MAG: acetyl-CoA carboxylase, biotin carboxyl carrier protein [Armatimonadetes bacterium]|nr:acetyl-CoA carboxylase, biotin carboxyl carrier protein [Armatimonadota bacterium]
MEDLIREVEAIASLLAGSTAREVTLRAGDRRIVLRREPSAAGHHAHEEPASSADHPAAGEAPAPAGSEPDAEQVTASLVGVFHHLERPIAVGDLVTEGQVVGGVESMKLMSEVRSETTGVVRDVLVEDGASVEYGQPLFAIAAADGD